MATGASKPRPNGPQGGAKKNPKMKPTEGGMPVDRQPKPSTQKTTPTKAPGSGTRGSGTTHNQVPR